MSVDWPLSDGRQAQVFYSFQRSALPGSVANQSGDISVNINYLHFGGRVFFHGTEATSSLTACESFAVPVLPGCISLTACERKSGVVWATTSCFMRHRLGREKPLMSGNAARRSAASRATTASPVRERRTCGGWRRGRH